MVSFFLLSCQRSLQPDLCVEYARWLEAALEGDYRGCQCPPRYFSKMTHFSPFQRIDVERWDDEPVCFQRHRKMVDLIRTKLNITRTIDLPPCETLRLFCSL
ncbi:hypothetical protein ADUPG1_004289, partial [Aduncisulcus paluster]